MTENTYIDGIGGIAVVAGNVRVTLFSYLAEPEEDGQQAVQEPSVRLVMSRNTFLKTCQRFQRMAHEMDAKGMFARQEPDEAADAGNTSNDVINLGFEDQVK